MPNDERVVREKGSKRVMLKNVQQAKFDKTLLPISQLVLRPADQADLSFEAFFTHILMHELMHGLGPHNIAAGGRATTVRMELKENYSAIEEAEAEGDYSKARLLLDKYAVIRPGMSQVYSKLGDVPMDIEPTFPLAVGQP